MPCNKNFKMSHSKNCKVSLSFAGSLRSIRSSLTPRTGAWNCWHAAPYFEHDSKTAPGRRRPREDGPGRRRRYRYIGLLLALGRRRTNNKDRTQVAQPRAPFCGGLKAPHEKQAIPQIAKTMEPSAPPSDSGVVGPEDPLAFLWRQAREIFLNSLGARQADKEKIRDHTTLDELMKSLRLAHAKAATSYGPKFVGKPIEFKLGRVLQRLDYLLRIGDEAMRFAPESASYVWSAFRLIFAGFVKDFETCQFLADTIDTVSNIIFVCGIYARRQLKKLSAFTKQTKMLGDEILKRIPALLGLVLSFAYEARKLMLDQPPISKSRLHLGRPSMAW